MKNSMCKTKQLFGWSKCSSIMMFSFFLFSVVSLASSSPLQNKRQVVSSLDNLPYDENGKLENHVLIYSDGQCANLIEETYLLDFPGFEFQAVTGDAEYAFFGSNKGGVINNGDSSSSGPISRDDCHAVCVERGVDHTLVSSVLPYRYYDGYEKKSPFNINNVATNKKISLEEWFNSNCVQVEVGYMNYWDKNTELNVYWLDPANGSWASLEFALKYGERNTKCVQTYIGHTFKFEDSNTQEVVKIHTVEHTAMISIGEAPPYEIDANKNYTKDIKGTLNHEWYKHNTVNRTFSTLGFRKGRLPDSLYASMGAFYYNNRVNIVREEWSGKGLFVNWWEHDVLFIQIPWRLKNLWQQQLLDLVQKWVGVELEQTDMYGMRQYISGARLLTHVDRRPTHVASLIVNVAQGNLQQPWPIELHDHADRLHQITMEPGDIVYYESAKCLHGRNTPLKGNNAYYVNLFTHYRPKNERDWHTRPNDPHTPEPLLDVGKCTLKEGMTNQDIGVGAVECDNPSVGPYLSPSLFTAASGEDLFQWWYEVGQQTATEGYNSFSDEL